MTSKRPSPLAPTKRAPLALKRADGECLTRADIQYDVLHAIFSDRTPAFTDAYHTVPKPNEPPKLCFRDLYIKTLKHSPKASKALKDKMNELPLFADDFAMLAMLVNVGRINTTMSFFPEMKTTIRTYHPIPTLQRTSGNLQDAPRIKHILKQALLEREMEKPPSTPEEILEQAKAGRIPSTSIPNLLFVLSGHSTGVGPLFSQRFEFLDIFLRTDISSASRSKAFLWLCFNYLENPGSATDDYDEEEKPNPFADPVKNAAPVLISLTPEEVALENVDTPEELERSEKLLNARADIVKQNALKEADKGEVFKIEVQDQPMPVGPETKSKGKKKGANTAGEKISTKRTKTAGEKLRKDALKNDVKGSQVSTQGSTSTPLDEMSIDGDGAQPSSGFRVLSGKDTEGISRGRPHRFSPYPRSPEPQRPRAPVRKPVPERTMLEHAWYLVRNTDPLMDSDDEGGDEHDRHDYTRRLKVVTQYARQWTEPSHSLQRLELSGN